MINPLSNVLPVEERTDGVYLKIGRKEQEQLPLDEIFRLLRESEVVNADNSRIEEVYRKASGRFEKIGPLFELYFPDINDHVQVWHSIEKATLSLSTTCVAAGIHVTPNQLRYHLMKKGIIHGVQDDQLKMICRENLFNTTVEVAAATKPVPGADARIEFLVNIDPDSKPRIMENGKVDYREIKSFVSVAANQVIARKTPATQGTQGLSVLGDPIPSMPGKDVLFPAGRNTVVLPDGVSLAASKTGIIYLDGALINVIELLDIPGNVDFSVGNIKYSGDVVVHGNVLPGFKIEAEGSVHIKGEVESARVISRSGDVHVEHGIIGKGDTFISAKKGINILFAQEANLSTEGMILVEKYLLHCECTCLCLQTKDNTGSIIGGVSNAERFIKAGQLGSDKGHKTVVTLFDRERKGLEGKLAELLVLEKKLLSQLEPIEKQLKTKSQILKRFQDEASNRQVAEIKKWIDAYNAMNVKVKYVRQKMEEIRGLIEKTRDQNFSGYVKIAGNTFPGTELNLYDRFFTLQHIITNANFRINKADVVYGN